MLTEGPTTLNHDQMVLRSLKAMMENDDEKVVHVQISEEPLNEFEQNDTILGGAFPALFPLGLKAKQLRSHGQLQDSVVKRLLCCVDDRFATCADFQFLLLNQQMRHEACRQVKILLHDQEDSRVADFLSIVNDEKFEENLQHAILYPESKEAKRLLSRLLPTIKVAGGNIEWGHIERERCLPKIYALTRKFGVPFMFITISPKVIDNELCLVFAAAQDGNVDQCELKVNVAKRAKLLSKNPVAVTRAYEMLAQAFMSILLGRPTSISTKSSQKYRRGLFGPIVAAFGVHEVQGRGYLHMHLEAMGLFDPVLAQQYCHDPAIKAKFCRIVDSITSGSLDGYEDERAEAENAREERKRSWEKRREEIHEKKHVVSPDSMLSGLTPELPLQTDSLCEGKIPIGLQPPNDPRQVPLNNIQVGMSFEDEHDGTSWIVQSIDEEKEKAVCLSDDSKRQKTVSLKSLRYLEQLKYINHGGQRVAADSNHHVHTFTCHKTTKKYSQRICRMAMPRHESLETRFIQIVAEDEKVPDAELQVSEVQPNGRIDPPPPETNEIIGKQ